MSRVLIGGVGYRWMRDASFGLVISDALARLDWPPGTEVADLGYGAIYAAQDIAAARPDRLILIAGVERGRTPGQLYRREPDRTLPAPEEIQARVREAGAGVIDLDHLLVIAGHFGALPPEVVVLELEPADAAGGDGLSDAATARLPEAIELVRREALRVASGV
jgi:hydrogenase maturation protease